MPEWMLVLVTYAVINLIAPNATLTQGNRLQLTLGGALVGLLGIPLARQIGNPEHTNDVLPTLLVIVLSIALLLIPALALLDGPQRPRLSVGDGFLLGFLPAFGYDAVNALLLPEVKLGLLPPDARGYAYLCGLITLGWTAGYRLSLLEGYAQFWAFCAFCWGVLDHLNPVFYPDLMTRYGVLPWVSLVLLLWMAWLERVWVGRSPGHKQLENLNQLRIPGTGAALKSGPTGWIARERAVALKTQLILERTESLERGRTVMGEIPTAYRLDPPHADPLGWVLRGLAVAVGALLILGGESLVVVLAGAALVAALYLRTTDLDLDEANSVVANLGHQIALNGALVAALALLCFSKLFPGAGLILGIALVAAALQDPMRREWQLFLEPYQRRVSMLHRAIALFLTVALCLAGVVAYDPLRGVVAGLIASVTKSAPMLHYTTALTLACLLALVALVAGKVGAALEEAFNLAGRRSAHE